METTNLTPNGDLAFDQPLPIAPARVAIDRPLAQSADSAGLVVLYTTTLFLSAFLLFLVQPMVAKMVLPILGGAAMVWNACMVFFQFVLLAGYGYAYGASRLRNHKSRLLLHAVLLVIPLVVLPVVIDRNAVTPPEGNPIGWLLVLLASTIGLPFFVLSTSASVLQHWFSRTSHSSARDPYFLYAASNLGSLIALASYPIVFEPLLTVGAQSRLWTAGYGIFVALAGACAWISSRHADRGPAAMVPEYAMADDTPAERLSPVRRIRWVALAFVPSSLMLAVTSYLSTDIAAVPLLWILPLALYLLTFIVAFSAMSARARAIVRRAVPLLVVPLALFMTTRMYVPLLVIMPLHLLAFVFIAVLCHTELASDRPEPVHLTEFYLWISVGGMLGGTFNTLLAPLLFRGIGEYPLVLAAACLFLPAPGSAINSHRRPVTDWLVPLGVGVFSAALLAASASGRIPTGVALSAVALPALGAFSQRQRPRQFALSVAAMLLAGSWFGGTGNSVLYRSRTFFGVYRVSADRAGQYHTLVHGTTIHGMQALDPAHRSEPLTYFHRTGPFGQAFSVLPQLRSAREIAVIGLGVGTLANYATSDQRWTFYEIDPEVERIARDTSYFTFLDSCGPRCQVVIGDARLSLARAGARQYDLIALDAFSSDAIPVHLLTEEALSLYLSRLAPGGVLAFHISNGHLELAPVVAGLAASHHLVALDRLDRETVNWPKGKAESHWVIMGRTEEDLGPLMRDAGWQRLIATNSTPHWTDDFSNILSVLDLP